MVPLVDDRAVVGVTDPYGFAGAEAGGGREAHRSGSVELRELYRVRGQGSTLPVEALEVIHELPCLIATHAADHLSGDGLPGVQVCQIVDRGAGSGGTGVNGGGHESVG